MTPGPGICLYFPARTQEQRKLRALVEVVKGVRFEERAVKPRAKPTSGAAGKK